VTSWWFAERVRFTSEEVHQALFPKGKGVRGADVKAGIREHIRKKHARS